MRLRPPAWAILALLGPLAAAQTVVHEAPAGPPPGGRVSLSLAEALARSQAHSARLASLRSLEEAAQAGRRAARAAGGPQLELQAGYTRLSSVPELTLHLPGTGARTLFPDIPDQWRARAALAQPLHTGGRVPAARAAAQAQDAAAGADLAAAEHDLRLETSRAYWGLVAARESERVLGEALAAFDQHLADARHRLELGLAARNEVLAVSVERERAELGRVQAEAVAASAEADLCRLTGLPEGTLVEPSETVEPPPAEAHEETPATWAGRAAAQRAELRAAGARAEAALAQVRVQRAAGRPQAQLAAAYDLARPNPRVLPLEDSWKRTWSVGLALSWSVFDAGRAAAASAQARAQAEALGHQRTELERRVRLEATQRALELGRARRALAVADQGLEAARENLRVALDRHREGLGSSADRLDAEAALLRAGLDRTAAVAAVHEALAALRRAAGGR